MPFDAGSPRAPKPPQVPSMVDLMADVGRRQRAQERRIDPAPAQTSGEGDLLAIELESQGWSAPDTLTWALPNEGFWLCWLTINGSGDAAANERVSVRFVGDLTPSVSLVGIAANAGVYTGVAFLNGAGTALVNSSPLTVDVELIHGTAAAGSIGGHALYLGST